MQRELSPDSRELSEIYLIAENVIPIYHPLDTDLSDTSKRGMPDRRLRLNTDEPYEVQLLKRRTQLKLLLALNFDEIISNVGAFNRIFRLDRVSVANAEHLLHISYNRIEKDLIGKHKPVDLERLRPGYLVIIKEYPQDRDIAPKYFEGSFYRFIRAKKVISEDGVMHTIYAFAPYTLNEMDDEIDKTSDLIFFTDSDVIKGWQYGVSSLERVLISVEKSKLNFRTDYKNILVRACSLSLEEILDAEREIRLERQVSKLLDNLEPRQKTKLKV